MHWILTTSIADQYLPLVVRVNATAIRYHCRHAARHAARLAIYSNVVAMLIEGVAHSRRLYDRGDKVTFVRRLYDREDRWPQRRPLGGPSAQSFIQQTLLYLYNYTSYITTVQ